MQFTPEELDNLSYDELKEHIRLAGVNREMYFGVRQAMLDEISKRSPVHEYKCCKCSHLKYEIRQMRVPSGVLSAIVNWNIARYSAVVCARCKYTEFYHGNISDSEFVVEVFLGS